MLARIFLQYVRFPFIETARRYLHRIPTWRAFCKLVPQAHVVLGGVTMEEQWQADRTMLQALLRTQPHWRVQDFAEAIGRSRSWVKKWRKRLQ